MTPELIGIILVCILVVICGPAIGSFAIEYGVPFVGALFHRFVRVERGDIMSREPRTDRPANQYELPRTDPVRARQYQAQDGTNTENVPLQNVPAISHNMSRDEVLILLALQKDAGKYRYSKNQIASFVGGTRADVLAQIDTIRAPAAPHTKPVHSGARLERPEGGW